MPACANDICAQALEHLLRCVECTAALDEPFSHIYLDNVLPDAIYRRMLASLPEPTRYRSAAERHHAYGGAAFTRSMFALTPANLATLSTGQQDLWRGVAAALTAPELKRAVYGKLAKDLAFRFSIPQANVPDLAGFSRPTLYRETDGFEIPPHPDTRKKIVTMHLYLPADTTQLDLGTALYRRRMLAWPFGAWQARFIKVKQFAFMPNSGYAFAVNNTITRKSWHGRERLRDGAGVRNTLLNTFYDEAREEFSHALAA
jgi:hypothetical protein